MFVWRVPSYEISQHVSDFDETASHLFFISMLLHHFTRAVTEIFCKLVFKKISVTALEQKKVKLASVT